MRGRDITTRPANNPRRARLRHARLRLRRGVIFITALGIIVVLGGLLLSFAQNMRTEAIASANRLAQIQADAVELGAEQWVLSQVDLNATTNANGAPDSWTLVYNTPAEAVQVGNGYFWIIRPDEETPSQYDFGLVDECSKFNLNDLTNSSATGTSTFTQDELLALPTSLTQDVADAIADWHSTAAAASTDGAESDYYNGLQEPYDAKNQPFESVEEMLLVSGVTPDILWGQDTNRNGVLEDSEQQAAESAGSSGSAGIASGITAGATAGNDPRGIFRYLTVFTKGEAAMGGGGGRGGGSGGATAAVTGLININTASENVLMAMGLTQAQADALQNAAQSQTGGITDTGTLSSALASAAPPGFLSDVCDTSYQYSADIVAVSGDGRAFKRVRIVVDCSPASGSTTPNTPSQIVYRRDLSDLGWPLSPDIRTQLRSGKPFTPGTPGSNLTN
jgi:type II secretory pathway component PulK